MVVLILGLVAALASSAAPTALALAPSITVTPDSGLSSGQQVTVDGTGFTPSATASIDQCRTTPPTNTCFNLSGLVATDSSGDFSFQASAQSLFSDGTPCFNGKCYFRATDNTTITQAPTVQVSFTTETPDLKVTVADSPDPVPVGSQVTYTVTVENTSSADASGVELYALPKDGNNAALPIASHTGPGSCGSTPPPPPASLSGGTLCALGPLNANSSAVYTFAILAPGPASQPISLEATAWGNEVEPSPANNSDSQSTQQAAAATTADLQANLTGPSSVVAGTTIAYTAAVKNNGPDATDFSLSIPLDSDLSYADASNGCSNSSGTVTCTGSGLASGASTSFTIHASADHALAPGTSISTSETASTTGGTTDPTPGNNSDTSSTTTSAEADVSVSLANAPSTNVVAGQDSFTSTATVSNAPGPSDSGPYRVTFALSSSDLSFDSSQPAGCALSSGDLVCDVNGTIAPGGSHQVAAKVDAGSAALGSSNVTATVDLTGAGFTDPVSGNNTDSDAVDVIGHANLSASLVNSPNVNLVAGQDSFTSTATVSNGGPSDSHAYKVTYSLSSTDLSFAGSQPSGCSPSGATLVCNVSTSIASGGNHQLQAVTVNAGAGALGSYNVTATVAPTDAGVSDPVPSNDADTKSVGVIAHADLSVTADGPASAVIAGDSAGFDYTLSVSNGGPSDNHGGFSVNLPLDNGVTFSGAGSDSRCSSSAGSVTCTRNTALLKNGSDSFTVHVTTAPNIVPANSQAGGINLNDTAAVTAASVAGASDPTPGNDSDSVVVHVDARANLALTASQTQSNPRIAGDPAGLDYVVSVDNVGPSDNQGGFDVTFTPPTGVTYVDGSSSAACDLSGSVVTCSQPGLTAAAAPVSFTIHVSLASDIVGADPTNQGLNVLSSFTAAPHSGATTDPISTNNSQTVTTHAIGRADVGLTKTVELVAPSTKLFANSTTANIVTYRITVTNSVSAAKTAFSSAFGVTVTDPLDTRLSLATVCHVTGPSTCTGTADFGTAYGGSISVGTMAPNATEVYLIRAHAASSLRAAQRNQPTVGSMVSTATAASQTVEVDGTNNSQQTSTPFYTRPDPPTAVTAFAGNANAGVTWVAPAQDGGQQITSYKVTAHASNSTTVSTEVNVPPSQAGFNLAGSTYQLQFNGLSNSLSYTFTVQAKNAVDYSDDSVASNSISPSINNSAFVFTNGGTQQTAAAPTTGDPQVESQTFNTNTTGLGTITECTTASSCANVGAAAPTGAAATSSASIVPSTFCGGAPCIGVPVVTKLSNPANGRYTIILQYGKQIISGTGTSFKVYFQNPATQTSPTILPDCPKKGTPTVPACVVKIVSQPAANPALKVQLSVAANVFDPVSGTRK